MIYEVRGLSFSYPRTEVFKNASFTLNEGEIVTILGRNGVGKSTLMHCLLGRLCPQSGEIFLAGRRLDAMSAREIASVVGFVPQSHTSAFGYSVLDFVMMGCASSIGLFSKPGERERRAAEQALEDMGIFHLKDRMYTELSGGECQQVTIARATVSQPKVILFDEPTSHLDYPNQMKVLRIVRALSDKGYAVMITTHNPDHALLLGGTAMLFDNAGSVRTGPVKEVVSAGSLSEVYGTDVMLTWVENIGRMACLYPNL